MLILFPLLLIHMQETIFFKENEQYFPIPYDSIYFDLFASKMQDTFRRFPCNSCKNA